MPELYTFTEGDLSVTGTEEDLIELAMWIDGSSEGLEPCGKLTDLAFSIRAQLDEEFRGEATR